MSLKLSVTLTHLQGSTDKRGSFKAAAIGSLSAALSPDPTALGYTNRVPTSGMTHVAMDGRGTVKDSLQHIGINHIHLLPEEFILKYGNKPTI